jgi:tRNA(Ile)-lysidine synthase
LSDDEDWFVMSVSEPSADTSAQSQSATPIGPDEADALFSRFLPLGRLLVAVSGGSDSMALLQLLNAWRQRSSATPPELFVVTVDHALRPAAAAEATWVAAETRSLGLSHETLRWNDAKPVTGLQEAAREARYRLLAAATRHHQCDAIVLAHTQDDQAETVLMRLGRGSGVDGLTAMRQRGQTPDGVLLLRPFLGIPKTRLTATLEVLGKTWREDPSNADERFERVRLRSARAHSDALGLLPPHLAQSAMRLGRARDALDRWTNDVISQHIELHDGAGARVAEAEIRRLPDEIALRTLQRLLWAFGGQDRAPRLARLETLLADLQSGRTAATLGGCEITRTTEHLCVFKEGGRTGLPEISVIPGRSVVWDQRFMVTVDAAPNHPSRPVMIRPLDDRGWRHLRREFEASTSERTWSGLQFALVVLETALGDLPWRARLTLPSIWDGSRLVAVPYLGIRDPRVTKVLPWQNHCYQEFTGRERLLKAAIG